jgi:hypothetical protein
MPEIRLHHESGALVVWRGSPADLFAARQHFRRSFVNPRPGRTSTGVVRGILKHGLPNTQTAGIAAVEFLLAWALESGEDPEGSPPGWLHRYVGECDLDIWFKLIETGIALTITRPKELNEV